MNDSFIRLIHSNLNSPPKACRIRNSQCARACSERVILNRMNEWINRMNQSITTTRLPCSSTALPTKATAIHLQCWNSTGMLELKWKNWRQTIFPHKRIPIAIAPFRFWLLLRFVEMVNTRDSLQAVDTQPFRIVQASCHTSQATASSEPSYKPSHSSLLRAFVLKCSKRWYKR
jgi:hypothetical protein